MSEASAQLLRHDRQFRALLRTADLAAERGRTQEALARYQMAAGYAWLNHTGRFASTELEGALSRIASRTFTDEVPDENEIVAPAKGSVLHVATKVAPVGGHTRLVQRWIELDDGHCHSIALTRQGRNRVPATLRRAVTTSGGDVYFIDNDAKTLVGRARALRHLARQFERVIFHIHPYDVVPVLAFSERNGLPPCGFLNHADHAFWIGSNCFDVIANIRASGQTHNTARRGIALERNTIVPIPINPVERGRTRAVAKADLGIPEPSVLMLSIATEYKYARAQSPTFIELHEELVQRNPNLHVRVVGPQSTGLWEQATQRTSGRLSAEGVQTNIQVYYEAADLYVDSFPFSSLTSALDAAHYELPIFSFDPFEGRSGPLRGDDPVLEGDEITFVSRERYIERISNIIENEQLRLEAGQRHRARLLDYHCSPGWLRFCHDFYNEMDTRPIADMAPSAELIVQDDVVDQQLVLLQVTSGDASGMKGVFDDHGILLPLWPRLAMYASNLLKGRFPLPLRLLPERQFNFAVFVLLRLVLIVLAPFDVSRFSSLQSFKFRAARFLGDV